MSSSTVFWLALKFIYLLYRISRTNEDKAVKVVIKSIDLLEEALLKESMVGAMTGAFVGECSSVGDAVTSSPLP